MIKALTFAAWVTLYLPGVLGKLKSPATDFTAGHVDTTGCRSYYQLLKSPKLDVTDDCMVKSVEYMPHVYISKSRADSIVECRQICQNTAQCDFYTLVEPINSQAEVTESYCYTKPSPSYATYPIFHHRHYSDAAVYKYTSGAREGCSQTCKDFTPIEPMCAASTPASCELQNTYFSYASISRFNDVTSNYFSFPCCVAEKSNETTKHQFQYNKALVGGTTLRFFSSGVQTPEECATHCFRTAGCTDWNFIFSPMLRYLGGSCYLKKYDQEVEVQFAASSSHVTSIIGVHCKETGKCQQGQLSEFEEIFTMTPVNSEICLYENIAINNTLHIIYTSSDQEKCFEDCTERAGCRYSKLQGNICYLHYSNYKYAPSSDSNSLRVRQCNSYYIDDGCLLVSKTCTSKPISTTAVSSAYICSSICGSDMRCEIWSFTGEVCEIYDEVCTLIPAPGHISGPKTCIFQV